jgi:Fe-S cluster biogenesis protein NfuA/nitrite reductase/ring-hydroxylating ferredoxin subunit
MADGAGRVEAVLERVEALPDPDARAVATELAQALLDLYGEGLARMVAQVAERDDDGALAAAFGRDEVVAELLLLHGLHPVPVAARVRRALEEVRPYLESHGGDVELLGVEDGVVRLRLEGSCRGCPSSAATLRLAIEEAIRQAAPDVDRIEAEGAEDPAPAAPVPAPAARRSWAVAGDVPVLAGGELLLWEVGGEDVLFLRLERRRYAYRSVCPGCAASLGEGTLTGIELRCAGCGHRFDVRRAGRCLDEPGLHLEPVPLLVDGEGRVKVALGAAA